MLLTTWSSLPLRLWHDATPTPLTVPPPSSSYTNSIGFSNLESYSLSLSLSPSIWLPHSPCLFLYLSGESACVRACMSVCTRVWLCIRLCVRMHPIVFVALCVCVCVWVIHQVLLVGWYWFWLLRGIFMWIKRPPLSLSLLPVMRDPSGTV